MVRRFSKHRHKEDGKIGAKVLPDINIGDNIKEEKIYLGTAGASKIPEVTGYSLVNNGNGEGLKEKIPIDAANRIKFFDDFFSKENVRSLARIRVDSPGSCMIVSFEPTEDLKNANQEGSEPYKSIASETFDSYLKIFEDEKWGTGLIDYLRFLYVNGVRNVEYIKYILEEDMEALLKCLIVSKKLTVINSPSIAGLGDENGNILYWKPSEISSGFNTDFLACVTEEYKKMFEDASNFPDVFYAYKFFLENPMPKMKSLKLKEASGGFPIFPKV